MIDYKSLIKKAQSVLNNSYSPYSHFKVAACVLTKNNNTYTGVNIENSSYGATICAERVAISNAVLNNDKNIVCICIVSSSNDFTFPCGICRQTILEFANNKDTEIVVAKNENEYKIYTIDELLPNNFSSKDIK